MQYDIVIVGAGPSGSTLARLLDKNFKILILDGRFSSNKKVQKPCGGLLAPDAQKVLARFEITLPKDILVNPQIFAVKTIDVCTEKIKHYQRSYINMDREKFDDWLISLIPDNVDIVEGKCIDTKRKNNIFSVTYKNRDNKIKTTEAKYIIGADGGNSFVRRSFFPEKKPKAYVAIQQWFKATNENPFYSCIFDKKTSDCCSWSINKDEYFIFGGSFDKKNCRTKFEEQKTRLKKFGFNFDNPLKTEACIVLRPNSFADFSCGKDGVFLIGEAAGYISPSSFEGISWGFNSAITLAKIINSNTKNPNKIYTRKTFKIRFKLFLKILKCPFMYNPFLRKMVMNSGLSSIKIIED